MKQEPLIEPQIKLCTYKVGGKPCGVPFERPQNMYSGNWKQCTRCPKHRKKSQRKYTSPQPGHYEVKSKVIDDFLYGRI